MPTVQHNALTGGDLHEPKGVSGASANQLYYADGAGSGDWENSSAYGSIYTQESDSVSVSTIGTTAQTLPFSNDGPDRTTESTAASNGLTAVAAGDYEINFSLSFATAAAGDAGLYEFEIAVDGTPSVYNCKVQMSGSSDTTTIHLSGILTLASTEVVTVRVLSDNGSDTDDINIVCASLSMNRLL